MNLCDQNGDLIGEYTYDAYGNVRAQTGAETEFSFAGEQSDPGRRVSVTPSHGHCKAAEAASVLLSGAGPRPPGMRLILDNPAMWGR